MTEVQGSDYHFCFHRLAIHDLRIDGDQPFLDEWEDGTLVHLMCNGEIYNYKEIIAKHALQKRMKSRSDCEVILHLFRMFDGDIVAVYKELKGEFAFVMRMETPDGQVRVCAARDAFGVRPLYYGTTSKGVVFSSLLAGIVGLDANASGAHFPPGHVYTELPQDTSPGTWHKIPWDTPACSLAPSKLHASIVTSFVHAVRRRLCGDRKVGFFLSGGLDSSLVVAVAAKVLGISRPRTFSIGFDAHAPDLQYARIVAAHINADHTELILDPQEALDAMPEVMKALETYDITTIRASTPQYLLAQYVAQNTDVRVILNGDGSDEVSMGYLYNYYAPNHEAAHNDTLRLLANIHQFDGLRVDRTLAAHGLEARLPFLDTEYVRTYLAAPVAMRCPRMDDTGKKRMEKQLLRDAFAAVHPGVLPEVILYRQKEAFSDGVSTQKESWYHMVQQHVEQLGLTEEAWYKQVFDMHFPHHRHVLPYFWMPQWTKATDPSARQLDVYVSM
jgi:asparagine synthase (glutamine-hydrolysing)